MVVSYDLVSETEEAIHFPTKDIYGLGQWPNSVSRSKGGGDDRNQVPRFLPGTHIF